MTTNLGRILTTCGVAAMMRTDPMFAREVESCLARHSRGDWGDVSEDSRRMNDDALDAEMRGEPTDRLFSLYNIGDGEIYIITEWDGSVTTILLPEEY